MNIFEKIKQFFKKIVGNKPKMLETQNEITNDSHDNTEYRSIRDKFLEDIKFDNNDLLDPRVCRGEKFVPNILKTLGVNEDIINNKEALHNINIQFHGIADQNGLEMPNYFEEPKRELIDAILEAVKSSKIMSSDERIAEYNKLGNSSPLQIYYSLEVDKETGSVTMGNFDIDKKNSISNNSYKENKYIPDGKGNIILEGSYRKIKDNYMDFLEYTSKTLINRDGIAMEAENCLYKQKNGESELAYHRKAKRDEDYPFATQEEILVDHITPNAELGQQYMVLDMKDLPGIGASEYDKDTHKPVIFNDKKQLAEYYKENEEKIKESLLSEPNHGITSSKELTESLKSGMRKLAEKAGIFDKNIEKDSNFDKE